MSSHPKDGLGVDEVEMYERRAGSVARKEDEGVDQEGGEQRKEEHEGRRERRGVGATVRREGRTLSGRLPPDRLAFLPFHLLPKVGSLYLIDGVVESSQRGQSRDATSSFVPFPPPPPLSTCPTSCKPGQSARSWPAPPALTSLRALSSLQGRCLFAIPKKGRLYEKCLELLAGELPGPPN